MHKPEVRSKWADSALPCRCATLTLCWTQPAPSRCFESWRRILKWGASGEMSK
jgi:hypothetical protein